MHHEGVKDKLHQALQRSAGDALKLAGVNGPVERMTLGEARQAGVGEQVLAQAVAEVLGLPQMVDLSNQQVADEFVAKIPIQFARRYNVVGLTSANGHMPVAISNVDGLEQLEVIARFLGLPVRPVVCDAEQIEGAINDAYGQQTVGVDRVLDTFDRNSVLAQVQVLEGREDLLDSAGRAPVIKLVNLALFEAVKQQASDVHIQPYEERLVVRMRVDGVLYNVFDLPKSLQEEMVSRVKVMGKMDIAEKRLPQDGRTTVQVGDRLIDLRIASLPTSFGERIVIRLLDKSGRLYRMNELGMDAVALDHFRTLIGAEHGLVLVTGPTGSGKTTTLYAALLELNCLERNVLTLEDPIEYQLPGVSQTQVSTKKGMTFASGLRSVLRQDPDIIMVGEIRDRETATMAIQSALTGHLVFSTLHTNDAAGAVTRMLELGIEPYLVASSVVGVLAQRLVRQVCCDCGAPYELTALDLTRLDVDATSIAHDRTRRGVGCDRCRGTGYRGRLGIFELLSINDAISHHISHRDTASAIKTAAIQAGMKTLRDDGVTKINQGITTADEVVRVTARATT